MHPSVQRRVHRIIRESRIRPARALEAGGYTEPKSMLRAPELEVVERCCLNLAKMPSVDGITAVRGNANDMTIFEDGMFDLVLSITTLEHDKFFWLSMAEMKRVLAPVGLLVIGAPGYRRDPEHDDGRTTATYHVHYKVAYYRFSEQAFRDVFFEGMEDVDVVAILWPPRIIGHGWETGRDAGLHLHRDCAAARPGAPADGTRRLQQGLTSRAELWRAEHNRQAAGRACRGRRIARLRRL